MGSVGQAIGRATLDTATLGTAELLPSSLKKPLFRGVGAGMTLGVSEGVDALTKNAFKGPTVPNAAPAPTTASPAVQSAAAYAAQQRERARGYRSTILSQQFMAPAQPMPLKQTLGS